MKRAAPLALLMLAACIGTPKPERPDTVAVLTEPPGATITFQDGSTCQTPCAVTVPSALSMVIGKAGFRAVRADLSPADRPRVEFELEPIGRSAPVEVLELEELDEAPTGG